MEEEEGPSNVHSAGPTAVFTRQMSYKPSPSNGLNCMVKQNTIVGGSSIGGQLQQGVRSRFMDNGLCKGLPRPFRGTCKTGKLAVNFSDLRSGAPRGNYSLVNNTALVRDSDYWIIFWAWFVLMGIFGLKNLFLANLSTMGCLPVVA